MPEWFLQDEDGEVRECDDATLRKELRDGELSGLELVRREGETAWTRLHTLPVFAQEVPHQGDPGSVAARRELKAWAGNAVGFVGFAGFFGSIGSWHGWILWVIGPWALALGAHTLRALPALSTVLRPLRGKFDPPTSKPSAPVVVAESDPWLDALHAALQALQVEMAANPDRLGGAVDLASIRAAAVELHRRRLALDGVAAPLLVLRSDRAALAARLSVSDARTAEALGAELRSLDERIVAVEQAASSAERLASRERSTLHQIEGIRTRLLQSAPDPDPGSAVAEAMKNLDAELRSENEVAATLDPRRTLGQKQPL